MKSVKLLSIVGARPQFIKLSPLYKELNKKFTNIIVHTGQHYDTNMSDVFFKELNIKQPDFNLDVRSNTHGVQTGKIIERLDPIIDEIDPDLVLVYGDTNSTIAGALCAVKKDYDVCHIEAGVRSWDMTMPEEINRVLTDRISKYLFCPTDEAVKNLSIEGIKHIYNPFIKSDVYYSGDLMVDVFNTYIPHTAVIPDISPYNVLTIHRASNTTKFNLHKIFNAISLINETFIFPIHPRTQKLINDISMQIPSNIITIDPIGYIDMLQLMRNSQKIFTDSGGLQKEAYLLKKPCITLRNTTEWSGTQKGGWNVLTGVDENKIYQSATIDIVRTSYQDNLFIPGAKNISDSITNILVKKNGL